MTAKASLSSPVSLLPQYLRKKTYLAKSDPSTQAQVADYKWPSIWLWHFNGLLVSHDIISSKTTIFFSFSFKENKADGIPNIDHKKSSLLVIYKLICFNMLSFWKVLLQAQ